jgi:5-(carboxyamino)imidazole ribonucleotide synthase
MASTSEMWAGITGVESVNRIGVIGGGQLARMMAAAALPLGIELIVQTPLSTDPAVEMAKGVILAPLSDLNATQRLAAQTQVITFENEFVDLTALQALAIAGVCFRPSLSSLQPLLDKYEQRSYLAKIGLPEPRFAPFTPDLDLRALGFEFPLVVKSRRHGYDGQGTFILKTAAELNAFWQRVKPSSSSLESRFLVEEFVPYQRELAIVAARSLGGDVVTYPVVETQQVDQICRRVIVPAEITPEQDSQVQAIAHTLLSGLEAVGVFGIELFQTPAGKLLINEVAPRTHNSGHFSLDACYTSQFEQHLRAISGLPLGSTQLLSAGAVMVNLLGFESALSSYPEKRQQLASLPQTFGHWYGKTESRPGRKLGHVTTLLNSDQRSEAIQALTAMELIWYGA